MISTGRREVSLAMSFPSSRFESKARRIKLLRNGDLFAAPYVFSFRSINCPHMKALIDAINRTKVNDPARKGTQKGVRYLFTLDGRRINSIAELQEEESYVCSSWPTFEKMNYRACFDPTWHNCGKQNPDAGSFELFLRTKNWVDPELLCDEQAISSNVCNGKFDVKFEPGYPWVVVVIQAGQRPRKMMRMTLSRRWASTLEKVLRHFAKILNFQSGYVKKICSLDGRLITDLSGFFQNKTVFIATEEDDIPSDDLEIDFEEAKFITGALQLTSNKYLAKIISEEKSNRNQLSIKKNRDLLQNVSQLDTNIKCTFERHPAPLSQSAVTLTNESSPATPNYKPTKVQSAPKVSNKIARGRGSGEMTGITVLSGYKVGKILVENDFVSVRRCHSKKSPEYRLAVKTIIKSSLDRTQLATVTNEINIMRSLKHKNILQLVDEVCTSREFHLVMEYLKSTESTTCGDLSDLYDIESCSIYNENYLSPLVQQLLEAVKYMHDLSIVHRNIILQNVLIIKQAECCIKVKLGDFGLAAICTDDLHHVCGTPVYMAPEMLANHGYNTQLDMWAIGVVVYAMFSGTLPFGNKNSRMFELHDTITYTEVLFPSPVWDSVSDCAKDFISYLLEINPEIRATPEYALDHGWIADPKSMALGIIHSSVYVQLKNLSLNRDQPCHPGLALIATTAVDNGCGFSGESISSRGDQA